MENKEKELLDAIKEQVATAKEGMATNEEVVSIKEQLTSLEEKLGNNEELDSLKSQVEEIGLSLKGLKEEGSKKVHTSLKSYLVELLENHKEDVEAVKKGTKQMFFKAPATMTIPTNITGADASRLPVPEYIPGAVAIAERMPFYLEFADVSSTGSATIVWVDQANEEGDADWTAEGELKPLYDTEYVPQVSNAKKIAVVSKVSEEMLDDIDFMASEIDRLLRKKHDLKLEDGLINGDSGVDPNSVDGVVKNAPSYIAANPLSATIVEPNNFDVLVAAYTQIVNSSDGMYMPNAVFVNPYDASAMDLAKTSEGAYVLPPFTDASGRVVAGMRVVPKVQIPSGYFLMGDFSKSHVRQYKDFEITIGWENDDFRKNLRTIIGESRCHHYVSTNEYTAFVYDQFSVVRTDLLKV